MKTTDMENSAANRSTDSRVTKGPRRLRQRETFQRVASHCRPGSGVWSVLICMLAMAPVQAQIVVNSTGDADRLPLKVAVCDTDLLTDGNQCTLRAAIETANLFTDNNTIQFQLSKSDPGYNPFAHTWTVLLGSPLPDLTTDMQIIGLGAKVLTVQRDAQVFPGFRVFSITTAGAVTISGLTISYGFVNGYGGGIENASTGTVTISKCILRNNQGFFGGAVANTTGGTITISKSTLTENVGILGGGIYNIGTGNINGSAIRANSASGGDGGGVYNHGTLKFNNTTVADNLVVADQGDSSHGGGIHSEGSLTLTNCTVSGNSVRGWGFAGSASSIYPVFGGGIYSVDTVLNVSNCTIAANSAEGGYLGAGAQGGGVAYHGIGVINLSNSTIAGNSAIARGYGPNAADDVPSIGGGIITDSGTVYVKSTIIAKNSASTLGPDVNGSFVSRGFNLIGSVDGSTGFTAATDRKGAIASPLDPKLALLGNNGGLTQTMALCPDSPAIDKGTSVGLLGTLATDQRGAGFPRTIDNGSVTNATGGDGTDIGAFESSLP
jgi:hypothetical protein